MSDKHDSRRSPEKNFSHEMDEEFTKESSSPLIPLDPPYALILDILEVDEHKFSTLTW